MTCYMTVLSRPSIITMAADTPSPSQPVSTTAGPPPRMRDKPAAYAAYERSLARTKQPMPARMKRGLRIYMRGVVATRPCKHCRTLSDNHAATNSSRRTVGRKAFFGGLCVMPGKAATEYGGCCACIAAGVPGCSAEYDASLTPPPSSASSPIRFTAANHIDAPPVSVSAKRQREDETPGTLGDELPKHDPKRRMTTPASLSPRVDTSAEEAVAQTLLALAGISRSSVDSKSSSGGGDIYGAGSQSRSDADERAQLRQRAAELQLKLDHVTCELVAIKGCSEAPDGDETAYKEAEGHDHTRVEAAFHQKLAEKTTMKPVDFGRSFRDTASPSPQASDIGEPLGDTVSAYAAAAAATTRRDPSAEPAQRTSPFTHDDLLTFATTRCITPTVVKAYLDLLVAATPSTSVGGPVPAGQGRAAYGAHAAPSSSSSSSSSPYGSVYVFDPLFWQHFCRAPNDVSAWRHELEITGRHDVVLVPASVTLSERRGCGRGQRRRRQRKHWLLLMALRAERAIECYDSLCDSPGDDDDDDDDDDVRYDDNAQVDTGDISASADGEDRCWRALEIVRTALVERELEKYWKAAATAATDSLSTPPSSSAASMSDDYDNDEGNGAHAGEWELRIMKCAQQYPGRQQQPPPPPPPQQQQQQQQQQQHQDDDTFGGGEAGDALGALYMLWHARCILLGAPPPATLTHAPPPPGFRAQILRQLCAAC